jgi:transposase
MSGLERHHEGCASLRYLPQYSPDLNYIEMLFSKLKAPLRKAAERTIPRLRPTNRQASLHPNRPRNVQLFQARRECERNLL